jgi:hypothetical protein
MVNRVTLATERIEIAIEPWLWQFAITNRAAIDRYFAELQRQGRRYGMGPISPTRYAPSTARSAATAKILWTDASGNCQSRHAMKLA